MVDLKPTFAVIFILSLALAFFGGGYVERRSIPEPIPTYDERIFLEIPKDAKGLRRQILLNKAQGAMLEAEEKWHRKLTVKKGEKP